MLKKMLLLLMAAMLLVVPVSAAEEVTGDAALVAEETFELTNEQNVLLGLGLITTNSYGELNVNANVTRENFAGGIGTLLNIDPTYSAPTTYYLDVEPDVWSTHTVNKLVELGALTVPADKQFRPKDNITLNEAIKVFTCILGYGEVAAQGGFPNGYLNLAYQIDLLDGVNRTEKYLTNANLYQMMYNALHIEMLKVQGVEEYIEYSNEEKYTLLSLYHDIYVLEEGIVETVNGMSTSGKSVADGYSIIDGITFVNGKIPVEQYFGYTVTAYYKLANEKRELLYFDSSDNISITILSDDLAADAYASGNVYYYDEDDREKKLSVDSSATIIYNGEAIYSNIDAAFNVKYGEIRMIDRDDDGAYDVVYIEDYTIVVVKAVNHNTAAVVDALHDSALFDLSSTAKDNVWVYDEKDNITSIGGITVNAVLNVATSRSGKNVIVRVSNNKVSGTVDSIQSGEELMSIDGTEYSYMTEAKDKCLIATGKTGDFRLDRYGNVAYFEQTEVTGSAAVVLDVASGQGMDATIQLKLLNSDGNVEVKKLAKNAKIDGKDSKTYNNLKTYFMPRNHKYFETIADDNSSNPDATVEFTYELIVYRTNKDGDISYIDTADDTKTKTDAPKAMNPEEESTSLQLVAVKEKAIAQDTGLADHKRNPHRLFTIAKKYGRTNDFADDAVFFQTPMQTGLEDKFYSVATLNDLADGGYYNALVYSVGERNDIEYVVFYAESTPTMTYDDRWYWAANVREAVTAEGEPYTLVEAWNRGALVNVMFRADTPAEQIPKRLDLFRYKTDVEGYVNGIEIHYDYATNGNSVYMDQLNGTWAYKSNEHNIKYGWQFLWNYVPENLRLMIGHAVDVDGTRIEWGMDSYNLVSIADTSVAGKDRDWRGFRDPDTYLEVTEVTNLAEKNIIVYDAATDSFRPGSYVDIKSAKTYGRAGASQILCETRWGQMIQMFIINNRPAADYPEPPSDAWGLPQP